MEEIIEGKKQAEPPDWEEFYDQERPRLLGWVARRYQERDAQDAEDVVQDVFVNLLDKALHPIENLAAYAYRALGHRITDLFRRSSRPTLSLEDLEDTLGGHALDKLLEDRAESVEGELDRSETLAEVRHAVAQLPPKERAVLVATEIEGRTFQELSDEWDEPLGTLLSRKHRAVQKLKKTLNLQNEKGEK